MARLTQTVEVEASAEIELAPRLRKRLLTELATYAELEEQLHELTAEKAAIASEIERLREEAGAKSIGLDDKYRVTRVDGGTTKTLNKKKLLSYGITPAQLEAAYITKPKRAHTLITTPSSKRKKQESSDDE